jgi:phosphatidylinositol alpha-1,6-mannosyltransferase
LPADSSAASNALRRQLRIEHGRILLYAGRLTRRKGLLEFVEKVFPALLHQDKDLRLLVIGDEAADAIAEPGGGYQAQVQAAANRLNVAHAITFLGGVPDETLAAAYDVADALIFPVIHRRGDAEGFGMVAVEAAAHGVPTVAFRVGGIPDAVSDGISGSLVAPGDYDAFTRAVQHAMTEYIAPERKEKCRLYAAEFEWSVFGQKLRQLMLDLVANDVHGTPVKAA